MTALADIHTLIPSLLRYGVTADEIGVACGEFALVPLDRLPEATRPSLDRLLIWAECRYATAFYDWADVAAERALRTCQRCGKAEDLRRLGYTGRYCLPCYGVELADRRRMTNQRKVNKG